MKKVFKSRIFIFLATAILFAGIGVYGATKYQASDVLYNETTVEDALNELYNNKYSISPLYSVYTVDGVTNKFSVMIDMPENDYFNVTDSGTKITCKKSVTVKILATVNGIPNQAYGYIYVYKNGEQIMYTRAGSFWFQFLEIEAEPEDYFTWERSGSSVGGALVTFSI